MINISLNRQKFGSENKKTSLRLHPFVSLLNRKSPLIDQSIKIILKLKQLSIFIVFIFLVSILSVNYHHYENRIFQDDSLVFDTIDDNLGFLTCNICLPSLTCRFVSTIIIPEIVSKLHILTFIFFTRAPPI